MSDPSKKAGHWLTIAKRIHSIAQTGLTFSKDIYDRERYTELMDMSLQIFKNITDLNTEKLNFIFNKNSGYETPKLGIRAVIIQEDKILMVKEKMDGLWSLPGGYAETGMSPSEIVIKEVKEESGYEVSPKRILGLIDYNRHQEKTFPFDIYNLFMECEIIGGSALAGIETDEVGFFEKDNLPQLSIRRVTKDQILKMFELYYNKDLNPVFD